MGLRRSAQGEGLHGRRIGQFKGHGSSAQEKKKSSSVVFVHTEFAVQGGLIGDEDKRGVLSAQVI